MPPTFEIVQAAIFFGGVVLWIALLATPAWRRAVSPRVLPCSPSSDASWGLVDVAGSLMLLFVAQAIGYTAALNSLGLEPEGKLDELPARALGRVWFATGAANLLAVALTAAIVRLRPGGSWRKLGLDQRFLFKPVLLARELALAAGAFLMLAPVVYTVQALFVALLGESQHPLIETLRKNHPPELLAAAGFSAIVAAPIAEEFLFRVILQGWLEKLFAGRGGAVLLTGGDTSEPKSTPATRAGLAAIATSSLIFALLHYSHGPDPIALFVLSLGLGYLYRQTHRLLPCVIVHLLNNAFSFAILVASFES